MGEPLLVTLSYIHKSETENNAVKPQKKLLYRRLADNAIKKERKTSKMKRVSLP